MGLYKRGTIWYYDFRHKGQRYAGSTGKTSKREAQAVMASIRKQVVAKTNRSAAASSDINLLEAVERLWKERWASQKSGFRSRNRLVNLAEALGENPRLSEIDEKWLNKAKYLLIEVGSKPATINRYLAALKTLLRHARDEWGMLDRVPKITLYSEKGNGRLRTWTDEELMTAHKLLKESVQNKTFGKKRAAYPHVADLLLLLADTGFRLSEALNMTWEQVDWSNNRIVVHAQDQKGTVHRAVPMTRRVREILTARKEYKEGPFRMVNTDQTQMAIRFLRSKGVLDRDVTIHGLRHTYASKLVSSGVPLYTVKTLLGHSTISLTERYAHLAPEHCEQAVKVLENGHKLL